MELPTWENRKDEYASNRQCNGSGTWVCQRVSNQWVKIPSLGERSHDDWALAWEGLPKTCLD